MTAFETEAFLTCKCTTGVAIIAMQLRFLLNDFGVDTFNVKDFGEPEIDNTFCVNLCFSVSNKRREIN